ncbi:adenine nucleotide alpha hydrolases-likesuperfamily protein [Striga asiatica]|uniref:Adenine nucleotide alpha hydrolases-likesuperfamily protein n=1 Tax=Striga asiatica TaxID=4170 RepID=A0A5A7PAA5_STRAF|nr:adenine nucleotide alpha hydrolases-likesuperfamily protein [Striga asiatica]
MAVNDWICEVPVSGPLSEYADAPQEVGLALGRKDPLPSETESFDLDRVDPPSESFDLDWVDPPSESFDLDRVDPPSESFDRWVDPTSESFDLDRWVDPPSESLCLDRVDPPPSDSLGFFRRDFLARSGWARDGESSRPNLTLPPSDESLEWFLLECLDLVDESFFLGDSFELWFSRLDDLGISGDSVALLPFLVSIRK